MSARARDWSDGAVYRLRAPEHGCVNGRGAAADLLTDPHAAAAESATQLC
jgi:hypothetical protein